MYVAVAFVEKKQINRNINLAGTRGKRVSTENGGQSYKLEDGYRVLEDTKMHLLNKLCTWFTEVLVQENLLS